MSVTQQVLPPRFRGGSFWPAPNDLPVMQGQQMAVSNNSLSPKLEDEVIDENIEPLTDEQLLLTNCVVKGYSMKAKRWGA